MFFGLTIEKLVVIGVIAALVVGPERLPRYAEALGRFTVRAKEWLQGAKTRVRDEMGSDFDDVDWQKLDPRQYDPRRIIREALLDDAPVASVRAASVGAAVTADSVKPVSAGGPADRRFDAPNEDLPPFDTEAT